MSKVAYVRRVSIGQLAYVLHRTIDGAWCKITCRTGMQGRKETDRQTDTDSCGAIERDEEVGGSMKFGGI